ncbi:uncharacterized protein LOC127570215 [Pristis pectinata]|uniref:uncharacterized protein LOC127570215 n=1 Tax=Pristis pectinata TaxID=685728 RepID=UPI00223E7248|nr:uncharacterized protein LOC127570215 [Pristis pectinata]
MLPLMPQLDSDDSDSSASSGGNAGTYNLQQGGDGVEQMMPLVPQLDLDDSVQPAGNGGEQMMPLLPQLDLDDSVQLYGSDQMSPLVPEPDLDDSDISQYAITDISDVQQYGAGSDQMMPLVPELDSDDSVLLYGSDQMSPLVPEPDLDDSDISQYAITDISDVDTQQQRFRSELYIPLHRARRPSVLARTEDPSRSTAASPPSQQLVPVRPRAHVPQDTFVNATPSAHTARVLFVPQAMDVLDIHRQSVPGPTAAADQHLPAARVSFIPRTMDVLDILPQPVPGTTADHGRKFPEDYKMLRRRERTPRKRPSVPAGTGYEASVGRRVQASVGLGVPSIDPNNLAVNLMASSQDQDDDPFKVSCRRKKLPRLSGSERPSRMRRQSGSGIRRPAMRRAARRPDANAQNVPTPLQTSFALLPHSPTPKAGTCPIASADNSLQRLGAAAPAADTVIIPHQELQRQGAAAAAAPDLSFQSQQGRPRRPTGQRARRRRSSRRGVPTPPRPGLRALGMEPLHEDEPHRRVIGEIAFQLDRRILSYVFNTGIRMYGFRVLNIPEKINQVSTCATERDEMSNRYRGIMQQLGNFGYCPQKHPKFAESIVNTFGILKEKPQCPITLANYNNPEYLKKTIHENAPLNLVLDLMVLLNCLSHMSVNDRRPLFIW